MTTAIVMPAKKETPLKYINGTLFRAIDNELVAGLVPATDILDVSVSTETPILRWKGKRIPYSLLCQAVTFFKWVNDTTHSEAQARFLYRESDGDWQLLVLPQTKGTGMSVNELPDHPLRAKLLEVLSEGYSMSGTIHSHCNAGAFQSSTDTADEINQPGIHITVGHLDKEEVDWHCRWTFRGHQYAPGLMDWIGGFPESISSLPTGLFSIAAEWLIDHPLSVAFPEEWKERMIEVPARVMEFADRRGLLGNGPIDWDDWTARWSDRPTGHLMGVPVDKSMTGRKSELWTNAWRWLTKMRSYYPQTYAMTDVKDIIGFFRRLQGVIDSVDDTAMEGNPMELRCPADTFDTIYKAFASHPYFDGLVLEDDSETKTHRSLVPADEDPYAIPNGM